MVRQNFTIIAGLWIAAFLLTFPSPIVAGIYKQPEIAIFTLIIGIFLTLILVLDIRQDRIIKGLLIILLGVSFQTIYLELIFIFVPENTIPEDWKSYLDIYSQVLLFACSGAGGSIIAAHADKTSLDNDAAVPSKKIPDLKPELKHLTKTIENLNKKFNITIGVLTASTLMILGIFLIR